MSKYLIKLEPIEPQHLTECANLFVSVFNSPPWNETWKQELAFYRLKDCYYTPGSYGVIATVKDKIVGFAIGYGENYCDGKHFYLKEMCVKSINQRIGIGTKIVDALFQFLNSQNIKMVYLLTMRDSIAEAFYKKCDFENSKITVMFRTTN